MVRPLDVAVEGDCQGSCYPSSTAVAAVVLSPSYPAGASQIPLQVLIGHSERRGEFGIFPMDNNDTLAIKLKYILDAGMSCVFCIGEPKEIREKGLDAVLAEMDVQLSQIYSLLDPEKVCLDVVRAPNSPCLKCRPRWSVLCDLRLLALWLSVCHLCHGVRCRSKHTIVLVTRCVHTRGCTRYRP